LGHLSGDALSRRARILQVLGEDELALGNIAKAYSIFREASRITAEQLARRPDNADRRLDDARSDFWIGRIHELRREWPEAQHQYVLFERSIRSLVQLDPQNPSYLREAAWSAIDLGNVQLYGFGNPQEAQQYYTAAVRIFSRLVKTQPNDDGLQRDLANAYGWLADSYFIRNMWRQSLDERLNQLPIVARLVRMDPRNVEDTYRYALAVRAVSRSYVKLDDRRSASPLAGQAYSMAVQLTNYDPHNADWTLFRGFMACDIIFGKLVLPGQVTSTELRNDIRRTTTTLAAENNPRAGEISRCFQALNPH
jgi:tetratricopeptide (TPR) repeat protein